MCGKWESLLFIIVWKVNVLLWFIWLYRIIFVIFIKINKKGFVFLLVFLFDNLEVLDIYFGSW